MSFLYSIKTTKLLHPDCKPLRYLPQSLSFLNDIPVKTGIRCLLFLLNIHNSTRAEFFVCLKVIEPENLPKEQSLSSRNGLISLASLSIDKRDTILGIHLT